MQAFAILVSIERYIKLARGVTYLDPREIALKAQTLLLVCAWALTDIPSQRTRHHSAARSDTVALL